MTINYRDGSTLECSDVVFYGGDIIADDVYTINIEDIESITED